MLIVRFPPFFATLMWPLAQALFEQSRAKLEFLRHEQGPWGCLSEETRRTVVAEARLAEA
jgi:hypothetical protein